MRYVRGEAMQTATSLTINEVDNGKPYKVALVVVDFCGNVAGVYFNRTVVPKPVTDLGRTSTIATARSTAAACSRRPTAKAIRSRVLRDFRDTTLAQCLRPRHHPRVLRHARQALRRRLGRAARDRGALPPAARPRRAALAHASLPGMLALFVLIALRRRVRRAVLALAFLAPSVAAADDLEPYWDTQESDDSSLLDFPDVKWHVGIRVGPYIPEIDLQAGLNAATGKGPYEAMFGDYYLRDSSGVLKKHERAVWQVLPLLDVDRVLWDGFGQVTVGGSLGYMQKSAYAYLDGTTEHEPMRERSKASRNTFRMIPTAATVGYRFTYFDDMYGIPSCTCAAACLLHADQGAERRRSRSARRCP
jgi:hypothetical protein